MVDLLNGMKVVGGEGPKNPKLILIGESLGEQEEIQHRPFVGPDGKILDGILSSAHIRREDCYITNVVKVRPPSNKIKRLGELGLTIEDFTPALLLELEAIDCNVCVPLGDVALNVLCQKDGITKHRGSIYNSPIVKDKLCLPTFNPGFVREFYQSRGVVVEDLKKAIRVKERGYEVVTFDTLTRPTLTDVEIFISRLKQLDTFAFDIETVIGNQIACIGIGGVFPEGRQSMCIPFKHGYRNYWERSDEIYVWRLLSVLFQTDCLKIGQNISYDLTYLLPYIGEPSPPWYDLMVAHHCLDPELPHTLAFITSIYTDIPYYKDDPKDEGESWKYVSSSEQLWEYNGKDVEVPLIVEPLLTKEMEEAGMLDFFRGYQMALVRVMWRISQRGMLMDDEKKRELFGKALLRVEELNAKLEEVVGHPVNVSSPKQMMTLLYSDLKLPVQYHRKTRKPTANKETLERLFSRYPNSIFKLALDIRDIVKDIGTYLNAKASADGRYRTSYNPTGTETGRSSSKKTIFNDGLDMQNIPRPLDEEEEGDEEKWKADIRGLFMAGNDKVFDMWDLWQAEAYCVAIFSKCQAFLTKLGNKNKIHTMVAGWIYGKEEKEITPKEYYVGKRTVHASNYGLGPILFSVLIKKSVKEAKEIMDRYRSHAPEIEMWHRELKEELRKRKLVTPFGRQRWFRNRYGEDMFREAYAHLPQSTIADYCHQAMIKIEYGLPEGAEIVQEGFDSLIIERIDSEAMSQEIEGIIKMAFDKTLFWKGEEFKIPVERKVDKRWGK